MVFGLSVLWLARFTARRWGVWGAILHGAFGVALTATAAFSTRSWVDGAPFDRTEDLLHSISATAMGFAFAIGIFGVAIRRARRAWLARGFDILAISAAVMLPLGMTIWAGQSGLIQRLMFAIAYAWYATEAIRSIDDYAGTGAGSGKSRKATV